ncbi:hypothetical protein L1987_71016 [Smallanthus sonchifolius]|uniref:Uncharacterized protein n=1 Tax=Smallanthus sonchifolius TaxID=185202 RepID=A0ACB9AQX5_9ASTR|nr:hypothetical protein L1987_71016 [Smallanthus sonchifolius]
MSTARSHEDSVNNDTKEPSEHSSSSRGTLASRSLNIRLNAELLIAAPATGLRSRPIARRTWPHGMSPPRQTQPQQPQQPPRLPSPRHQPTSIHEVRGPSTPIVGIPVGRLPPGSWERDYLTLKRVRQLHEQGFEHEIPNESGYVVAIPPCPRAAYVTGPEPIRTIDLNLPDQPHNHALGKCPMWLLAKSSGIKSDACSPFATQKDLKSNATSPRRENTVSAPMRLECPKARTRENARKRTHLSKKVTFKNIEMEEPSTKAPQVFTPRESTKDHV